MERFHKALLAGFVIGTLSLTWAADRLHESLFWAHLRPYVGTLPEGVVRPEFVEAGRAKRRGLFWLLLPTDYGAALDLRASPGLFEEVFPGYADARSDEELWRRARSFEFDSRIYAPSLSDKASAALMSSFRASMELVRRHGARHVLLGTSETFSGVVPAVLARRLGGPVVSCTFGGMTLEGSLEAAKELAASGRRFQTVFWGYSAWYAHRVARREAKIVDAVAAAAMETPPPPGAQALRGWGLPVPLWSDWLRLSYQTEWDQRKGRWRADVTFPDERLQGEAAVARAVASVSPGYFLFDGIDTGACRMQEASLRTDAVLAELLRSSDRVVLFVPPTTPLQTGRVPACYMPALRRMLLSKRGPRVLVEAGDWRSFGVGWTDFLRPSNLAGHSWLDINHLNYGGALKVTERLASACLRRSAAPADRVR